MVNPLFPSYRFTWFDILTSSALASTSKLSLDVKSEVTNHKVLLSGMDKSEDSAAAAAVAFRHICDDCRRKLCGYFDELFSIYHRAVIEEGSFKVSAEDSLHMVEAFRSICYLRILDMVITELPADQALEKLCLPFVTPLQEIISHGPEVLEKKPARELTVHTDRLAYVNQPQAVADAIQRLWPIVKAIFDVRAWDMRTMESLCRACKYAVRTSGRFMGITIGAMLEEIQGLFQQHHQPCFLYLASEVIRIFGSDPSCAYYLNNLIEALFKCTTCLLTNIKDFIARPDIADDCFLLALRCIRYCPQVFIPSTVFPALMDCSMIGITVQHKEASISILTFLSDIFDLAKSTVGEQYLTIRESVIIPRGVTIARILVASLTGAHFLDQIFYWQLKLLLYFILLFLFLQVTYALVALTRAYGASALEWARGSVSLIPSTAVTEVERTNFLQALNDAASGIDINTQMAPIEELSDVCRRNRTVQDIVQGALRSLELHLVTVSF
ncbi:transportin [Salix suchowensis]|nr:transportin [Salix suchowensis]